MMRDKLFDGIMIRKYSLAWMLANWCGKNCSHLCPLGSRCPMERIYPEGFTCESITAIDWEEVLGTTGDEFLKITLTDYDRENL